MKCFSARATSFGKETFELKLGAKSVRADIQVRFSFSQRWSKHSKRKQFLTKENT